MATTGDRLLELSKLTTGTTLQHFLSITKFGTVNRPLSIVVEKVIYTQELVAELDNDSLVVELDNDSLVVELVQ